MLKSAAPADTDENKLKCATCNLQYLLIKIIKFSGETVGKGF